MLPLEGGCTVVCDDVELPLEGRDGVFAGVTDFAYVPRDAHVATAHRSAAAASPSPPPGPSTGSSRAAWPPRTCRSSCAAPGVASRQVNNFCAPDAFAADRLIAVEVLTPGGNWSSYPPHKHDEEVPGEEVPLEEIYYFEVAGGGLRLPARLRLRPWARDRRAGRGAQRRRAGHAARLPRPVDGRAGLRPLLPQRDGRPERARLALPRRPRPRLDPRHLGGAGDRSPTAARRGRGGRHDPAIDGGPGAGAVPGRPVLASATASSSG